MSTTLAVLTRIADALERIAKQGEPIVITTSGVTTDIDGFLNDRRRLNKLGKDGSAPRNPDDIPSRRGNEPAALLVNEGPTQVTEGLRQLFVGHGERDGRTAQDGQPRHETSPSVGSGASSVGEVGALSGEEPGRAAE